MRAVGYAKSLTSDQEKSLEDITIPEPAVGPRDLLVRVAAVSVNPVDVKVRMRAEPAEGHTVLGFDAVGVVEAIGSDVTLFSVGDEVFYAGDITRPGSNAELQAVDERIVGRKPSSLSVAEAAALPLTGITAWEILFESFRLKEGEGAGKVLLIIGAAGGVGSMLMQLAKAVTGLTVVATASRKETTDWCRKLGADHIIDHSQALKPQLDALGLTVDYVAALTASDQHLPAIVDLIRPRGQIAMIDDPVGLDFTIMKKKALSLHWELMFTRSMFGTDDMVAQHELLNRIADLVDSGRLQTTMTSVTGEMTAANMRLAHASQESGRTIGKTVLTAA